MRQLLAALALVLCSITAPLAQVSVNIGINLGAYPQLVRVPGYPVYYAPQVNSNYFFYDGMYWVYAYDNWYTSTWYNGPWEIVPPDFVPLYVLRVPVRYYRRAPVYFRGWRSDAPPRWRSLGQYLVQQSSRVGHMEPQRGTCARTIARLSASVLWQPLSACGPAGDAADTQLSLRSP